MQQRILFFGWKCIYCCVRVWGSSVRSCFLTLCYCIVLSRSPNARVCASLLMCECMYVGVFNAASNKPTKTVVAVAAGKANTKLVPLAALSVCLVAECYGIAPCSPLPRAVAPFCEWNLVVYVCMSDDALTPAHVPTHKQRLKQAYIRIHMRIYTAMCGFFHEWNSNPMYFSLAWRCRLPNTFTLTHTQEDTHLTYTKANANLLFYEWLSRAAAEFPMCAADNLVLSLAIVSFFVVCLFLDNTTFSYRLMCVRQYRERSTPRPRRVLMNGQRCLYRCTVRDCFPYSISLSLSASICLL